MAEAYVARTRGDGALALERSAEALSLLPPEDTASRSVVTINLGVAQWFRGDLRASEEALRNAESVST